MLNLGRLGRTVFVGTCICVVGCQSDPTDPKEEDSPPKYGSLSIDEGAIYTGSSTVGLRVTSANSDSCTLWNEGADADAAGVRVGLVEGAANVEMWHLTDGEGEKIVHAGFGTSGAAFDSVASDMIIVDQTGPSGAPEIGFPQAGQSDVSPVTVLEWTAAQDAHCRPEDMTYAVEVSDQAGVVIHRWSGYGLKTCVGDLASGAAYQWSVSAADAVGHGSESDAGGFTTWSMGMPDMMKIEPGAFKMGERPNSPYNYAYYRQHTVALTSGFRFAATQVTIGQLRDWLNWARGSGLVTVASDTVRHPDTGTEAFFFSLDFSDYDYDGSRFSDRYPGHGAAISSLMTWYGAAAFCDWLNVRTGLSPIYDPSNDWTVPGGVYQVPGYRLATEAEWEYACRAGTTTDFWNGDILVVCPGACFPGSPDGYCCTDPLLDQIGVYCGNWREGYGLPAMKEPNPWGIYDMHGGFPDWCFDYLAPYGSEPVVDPVVDTVGEAGELRILRGCFEGGPGYSCAQHCRSSFRNSTRPARDFSGAIRIVYSAGQ